MSHSPCGPNGTKWRRIAPLNRRLGQFELYSQNIQFVRPVDSSVQMSNTMAPLLARSSAKICSGRSERATSQFDFARQRAQPTRWRNARISASSISDFSFRRNNVGIARGAARKPENPPRPILRRRKRAGRVPNPSRRRPCSCWIRAQAAGAWECAPCR